MAPYVGTWVVEPTWLNETLRPPVGVAETFQADLAQSAEPVMRWERLSGSMCDPRDKIRIPLSGSVQSLDGGIQAVHAGAEEFWYVEVFEDGDAHLSIRSETQSGSLAWNDALFDGDPDDGHYWRFFVSGDSHGGELNVDHYVRNDETNSVTAQWSFGVWSW